MSSRDRMRHDEVSLCELGQRAFVRVLFLVLVFFALLYVLRVGFEAFDDHIPALVRTILQMILLIVFLISLFANQQKIIRYHKARGSALCNDGQVCPMCGHSVAQVSGAGTCPECGTSYTNYGLARYWEAVFKSGLYDYDRIILPLKDRPDPSQ
ncbi:MAG: hypothetical protein ACNA8P_02510 [Phycisphaerales bacterium]